jgi:hypothetical protein
MRDPEYYFPNDEVRENPLPNQDIQRLMINAAGAKKVTSPVSGLRSALTDVM